MHLIGISNGSWRYITDGREIYHSDQDVRYYSAPPRDEYGSILRPKGENRINRVHMTQEAFLVHCRATNVTVRSIATPGEKVRKASGPAAIGALAGVAIGGLIGAVVGAGLTGYIASTSEFEPENVVAAFEHAKKACSEWATFDAQQASLKAKRAVDYEKAAADKWRRFHKLRNLASVGELEGTEFEAAIAALYERRGYEVLITRATGDFGVDILATKGTQKLAIQTKRYTAAVGIKAVQEVASGASYYKATEAIVVTNSFYTEQAKKLAEKLGVTLINKKRLANMWEEQSLGLALPPFDLQTFERLKYEIERELSRIDSASGKKRKPRYLR